MLIVEPVIPFVPTAGTNVPGQTGIMWNWSDVNSPISYKWGSTNVYISATDIGTNTSYIQSGLTCGGATTYSSYVWAYNSCGNSSFTTLTQTTSACVCTITSCGGQVFMCTNLNAGTRVNQTTNSNTQTLNQKWCYNDLVSFCNTYGGLYQWATAMNISNIYNTNKTIFYGTTNETCNPCGPTTGKGGFTAFAL